MSALPPLTSKDRIVDAVLIPVLSIVQALTMGIAAFATRDAFAALHSGDSPPASVLATLLGAGMAVAMLGWFIKQRAEAIGQSYANALRIALYRHIAGMSLSALEQRRVGALSLRFVGDLSAARNWFGRGLPLAVSALFVLPGAAWVLYTLDPRLALGTFVPVSLVAVLTTMLAIGLQLRHRTLRQKRANLSISMIERIAVAPLLDLMGRTEKEIANLHEAGAVLRRNALSRTGHRNALAGMIDLGAVFAGASVLIVAGAHDISASLVAAALAMIAILVAPLRELALVWDRFCSWRVAREKALRLLAQPSANRFAMHPPNPVRVQVSGQMSGDFAAGQLHKMGVQQAQSGLNILRIIAGLDHSTDLTVRFDGARARPTVAYLAHRPTVLQGSLRRAATLGIYPRPKNQEILEVLAQMGLAHLADNRAALRQRVAEGGRSLTTAECFRLELARAALAKARLVLIESNRLSDDPDAAEIIDFFHTLHGPTIIVGENADVFVTHKTPLSEVTVTEE